MDRVYLVACSAGKVDADSVAARDLYNSQLFTLARRYAEKSSDPWFILSAKYGLLDPAQLVASYDESLNDLMVEAQLKRVVHSRSHLIMLAGRAYCDALQHLMEAQGHTVTVPMEGMAIGKQLQILTRSLAA
ncbi:hypothetical protein D3C87_248340 [compost metagenome]